ncbi:MAG TPA: MFS transporter [Candidatus Dormibacteraeota bacterium]
MQGTDISTLPLHAFAQLPGGALLDRLGPRRVLGAGLVLWSVAQAAAGFIAGFWQFVLTRALLGLGEAPMFSGAVRVVRDWYNVRGRGLPTGIWNCTSSLGPTIAPPLLTALMVSVGWRWMFITMGAVGVVIGVLWYAIYREVEEAGLTPEERHHLTEGEEEPPTRRVTLAEWRRLFAFRTTWGMIVGFFGVVYLVWLYQAWLPGYLEIQRHMGLVKTGWVASIPYAFGVVGSVGGGWVADRLMARGLSPINSRKVPVIVGLVGMGAFTHVAAVVASDTAAVARIAGAVFCAGCSSGMSRALASVVAPESCTASLGSIMNFGSYLGGALAPTVTGFIVQATGSFVPALVSASAVALVAALAYLLIVPNRAIGFAELVPGGRPAAA